ncbi:TetR/AcrR family transcriptional regulator [Embleya scabrispora]|uniref:TetR/AcrR family transcriptional regulator n=1 Tax=Embleya scabrispora TaxID=159449 RepID=UPI00036479F7|nr:TetR/AcrR family transcriptional regulator [Embleya scabrispora]MYS86903.1 TetR family transcriptional regulator [Streptomyces sp. SID5474]
MRTVDPAKHAAKRRQILEAAAACFADKGFHGTRTADICARAGMSPGNVFHYFPSKHAIIVALVEQEGTDTATYLADLARAEDPLAALFDLIDAVVRLAADPAYAGLTLDTAAEARRDEGIGALVAHNDRQLRAGIADLLRRAAAAGRIDDTLDPDGAATWVAAQIDGLFARVATDPDFAPLDQSPMLRLLLTRFLGAEPA